MSDLNQSFIIFRIIVLQGPGLPSYDPKEDLRSILVELMESLPDFNFNVNIIATIHRNRTKKNIYIE